MSQASFVFFSPRKRTIWKCISLWLRKEVEELDGTLDHNIYNISLFHQDMDTDIDDDREENKEIGFILVDSLKEKVCLIQIRKWVPAMLNSRMSNNDP